MTLRLGNNATYFQHLEQRLVDRLRTSRVVISTLPHRHDLPANHPLHEQTAIVNCYIEELSKRYVGLEMFDFNKIRRKFFTRHGMHLTMAGKQLLAHCLLKVAIGLKTEKTPPPTRSPPSPRQSRIPSTRTPAADSSSMASIPPTPPVSRTTSAALPEGHAAGMSTEGHVQPVVLPYDTFADAVKRSSVSHGHSSSCSVTKNDNAVFLGKIL